MRADRSALGTLPAKAYQYCEAVTAASGFGWYVFPAAEVQFWFDGVDVHWAVNDKWEKLTIEYLPDSDSWWKPNCPDALADKEPPFVTAIGVPGFVQIWSGLLVETARDWSVLVRPLANVPPSREYFCFEGIVETDRYSPAPLFINLKLQVTGEAIVLPADKPLFQVQPVRRESYARQTLSKFDNRDIKVESTNGGLTGAQWAGYVGTVRAVDPRLDNHEIGQYAKKSRKRDKKGCPLASD